MHRSGRGPSHPQPFSDFSTMPAMGAPVHFPVTSIHVLKQGAKPRLGSLKVQDLSPKVPKLQIQNWSKKTKFLRDPKSHKGVL